MFVNCHAAHVSYMLFDLIYAVYCRQDTAKHTSYINKDILHKTIMVLKLTIQEVSDLNQVLPKMI